MSSSENALLIVFLLPPIIVSVVWLSLAWKSRKDILGFAFLIFFILSLKAYALAGEFIGQHTTGLLPVTWFSSVGATFALFFLMPVMLVFAAFKFRGLQ